MRENGDKSLRIVTSNQHTQSLVHIKLKYFMHMTKDTYRCRCRYRKGDGDGIGIYPWIQRQR